MKVGFVTDWLDLYGGAERVARKMSEVFDFDSVYTLIDSRDEKNKKLFFKGNPQIKQTRLKLLGKKFRVLFPLFPYLIKKLKIDPETDLIISSSFNVAKGIEKTSSHQKHICYIQTQNFKYIEDAESLDNYFGILKYFIYPFIPYLKKWDRKSAKNPDLIIANSHYTKDLIQNKYNREAVVVYPPVELNKFDLNLNKEDYYVAIGRLAPMKRFDILIEAFNSMPDKKLIIIGDGYLGKKLRKSSKENIEFKGFLSSDRINEILQSARACVVVGVEDFGIVAVESQACGTPVIANRIGGTSETIEHGKTGLLFDELNAESIKKSVEDLEKLNFDYEYIAQHAAKFNEANFKKKFEEVVISLMSE